MEKIIVDKKLIDSMRFMLCRMAIDSSNLIAFEQERQYCEGYLGVKRETLSAIANDKTVSMSEVIEAMGL